MGGQAVLVSQRSWTLPPQEPCSASHETTHVLDLKQATHMTHGSTCDCTCVCSVAIPYADQHADVETHSMDMMSLDRHSSMVEVVKPAVDKLRYRCVVLDNNIRITLVSDPEADKAAAAMDVRLEISFYQDVAHNVA